MNENNLINEFLYFAENAWGKNTKTIKAYRICLEEMQEYLFENKEVTSEMLSNTYADILLLQWLRVKEKEGLKASSLNQRLAAVRSLLTWLCGRGDLTVNFAKMIPQFKNDKEQGEILELDECKYLLNHVRNKMIENENYETTKMNLIISIFLSAGLRIDETHFLNFENIDTENRILILDKTKFGKKRTVSIPEQVIDDYNLYLKYRLPLNEKLSEDLQTCLFISKKKLRLSTEMIRKSVYKIFEECGFNNLNIHSLRKSFASNMINHGGANVHDISKQLGHSNINTTLNLYTKQTTKDISKHNPLFNNKKEESKVISKDENIIQVRFGVI